MRSLSSIPPDPTPITPDLPPVAPPSPPTEAPPPPAIDDPLGPGGMPSPVRDPGAPAPAGF